ncbi:transcriptional antiterminator [Pseudomonas alcaligenes]|uniref:Transcriptional antiterminator n=1 Tax=Aquipseudomonas alcaligenes TaxID=43263 RepID=A0ABR7S3Z5_AQUAC|nr:Rho-binding antiterminator [Pseudomonas alcaligenes]MBC9251752.1 transcriptional antiterminator [Pseudomonas alcaligenes]
MNDTYQPLACDLYDYLEIACMHGYRLRIELDDGSELEATAVTTQTRASKEEFFIVRNASGEQQLRLDRLLAITPLDAGASFARVLLGNRHC